MRDGPRLGNRRADFVALFFSLAVLAFAAARAFLVPITHDEAFTFLHWSTAPWRAIFLFDGPLPTNNHLLNTVLMKAFSVLLGPREPVLRLPNLIALASYLASLWLLLRRYARPVLALSGFVLASTNRHLLEMFSLARGYGLCLGFLFPALLFAALLIEKCDGSRRKEWLSLGFATLAVLSQLVVLDVFVALAAVLAVFHAARASGDDPALSFGRRFGRRLVPLAVTGAALALSVGGILWRVARSGGINFGGTTGLWHDIVENLVWLTLTPAPWLSRFERPLLALVAALLVLLCGAGARLLTRRPRTASERVALASIAVFALTVLAVKAQNVVLGLPYPTDRIASMFIPLFVLAVTLGAATAPPAARRAATVVLAGLALLGTLHLVRIADVRRSVLWWFDADVRRVVSDLADDSRRAGRSRPMRVGSISHCEPALNYMRVVTGLSWLYPVERLGADKWDYDLCTVTGAEEAEAKQRGFTVSRRYAETGNLLLLPPPAAAPSSRVAVTGPAGPSFPASDTRTGPTILYGLRKTRSASPTVALVNAGASPLTLRVTLYCGDAGDGRTFVVSPDTALGPGQRRELGRVLDLASFTNGYAKVEIANGAGPYVAWASLDDDTTGSGSPIAAEPANLPLEMRLLPVLVESAAYETELVLTNPLAVPQTAVLKYVESAARASGAGGVLRLRLEAREQRFIPGVIDYFRKNRIDIGPRGSAAFAGTLAVTFRNGSAVSTGFVGARTAARSNAAGPGAHGLFYPAVGPSFAATEDAWVYGLVQESATRSNLAVANLGDTGDPITFRVDVYDGDTGRLAGSTPSATLAPGGWHQFDAVLRQFRVANGHAHVVRLSGSDHFIAYGVVHDGGRSGERTGDGLYLPMTTK